MNQNKMPEDQVNLEDLKKDLVDFCAENSISRFEAEDIIELLEDGEEVTWIVEQLQQDNSELDKDKLSSLLISIQSQVAPSTEEEVEPEEETITELKEEAVPEADLSQLDLKEMAPALEELTGMKLPGDLDLNQVKKMLEGPEGKILQDFAVWCEEQGIDLATISDDNEKIQELNNQWMQTPRPAFGGKTPAEIVGTGENANLFGLKKVETYRRETPRIGRNDPCPCGSGKKYKKCCGRGK